MKTLTFTVPDFALPYLFNGDVSGLDDEEIYSLDALENEAQRLYQTYQGTHYHWANPEPVGFKPFHDMAGIGASDCHTVQLIIMGA